jgi:ABC-type polar amino acid transport system ATPase subunit
MVRHQGTTMAVVTMEITVLRTVAVQVLVDESTDFGPNPAMDTLRLL